MELHGQGHIRETGLETIRTSGFTPVPDTQCASWGSSVPELTHLESEGKAHLPQTDAARLSSYLRHSEALGWWEVSISGILFLHTCYLQQTVGTHTDFYITRRRQTCFLPRSHSLYLGKQLKSRKQCWCCSYRKVFTPRPLLWWLASWLGTLHCPSAGEALLTDRPGRLRSLTEQEQLRSVLFTNVSSGCCYFCGNAKLLISTR